MLDYEDNYYYKRYNLCFVCHLLCISVFLCFGRNAKKSYGKRGDACAAVSSAVYSLLHGASKEEVLSAVPEKYLNGELYPSVDALEATRCAFCIFRDAESYTDAVSRACRLGGDTDTIGAISGGMCGALYGIEAVPKQWIDLLDVKERLTLAVEQVLKRSAGVE